jgi:hypothetical protein
MNVSRFLFIVVAIAKVIAMIIDMVMVFVIPVIFLSLDLIMM